MFFILGHCHVNLVFQIPSFQAFSKQVLKKTSNFCFSFQLSFFLKFRWSRWHWLDHQRCSQQPRMSFVSWCSIERLNYYPVVSVQGVKSLGGHFACSSREFVIHEVKFCKRKRETLTHFYSGKSSKRAKLHKSNTMTPNLPELTCNQPKVNQLLGD